ncbi:hypothetical protein BaRGS_00030022, partial [Batillaria attramentaria]
MQTLICRSLCTTARLLLSNETTEGTAGQPKSRIDQSPKEHDRGEKAGGIDQEVSAPL